METVSAKSCQSVKGMKRGLAAQVTSQLHGYQVGVAMFNQGLSNFEGYRVQWNVESTRVPL